MDGFEEGLTKQDREIINKITKSEMDMIAKKARRMADVTDTSAMTWFRYFVIQLFNKKKREILKSD